MKKLLVILLFTTYVLVGCGSTAVKKSVAEPQAEEHPIKVVVVDPTPGAFAVDANAYNYFTNGLIYAEIGDYVSAAGNFEEALKYHPESYQLRYSLAEVYYKLQRFSETALILADIRPVDEMSLMLRAAAFMYLEEGDSARVLYRELVGRYPDNAAAFSYLAGFYRQDGDLDSLIWAYENMTRLRPESDRSWQDLGRFLAQRGDYERARDCFKTSIELRSDPTNILSYVGLAELYIYSEQLDSALLTYKAALQVEPANIVVNRELTTLYMSFDSLEAALPCAWEVVRLSPLERAGVRRLAVVYYGLDSLERADSLLTSLVASGETNPANHFYLGRIAILEEDYRRAVDEFTVVSQLADSLPGSWIDLGYAYRMLGDTEKEVLTYQLGLGHMRDREAEIQVLFALGAAYERTGQTQQAVDTFEEIIAKAPENAQALNYLGYMLADRGERLDYAEQLIERAVDIMPENAAFLDSYGWVFYRQGKYKKAVEYLKKAVSLDSDPVIFDHLGDAYKAKGDTAQARTWWQKALELSPEDEAIKQKLNQ